MEGNSKSPLAGNVTFFHWTQDLRPKGSNKICSGVFYKLNSLALSDNIKIIRLVADGCGGQNKNTAMVAMCSHWLSKAPKHVRSVELIFPVVGHSYIPPDRVFGMIEKKIKKVERIIKPEEYINIFKEFGTTIELGTECPVFDWKSESEIYLKNCSNWRFKIRQTKKIILKRTNKNTILAQGEAFYRNEKNVLALICRVGKNIKSMMPTYLPSGKIPITDLKKKDVENLLSKHFGKNWDTINELEFYKNIINNSSTNIPQEEEAEVICEIQEESQESFV